MSSQPLIQPLILHFFKITILLLFTILPQRQIISIAGLCLSYTFFQMPFSIHFLTFLLFPICLPPSIPNPSSTSILITSSHFLYSLSLPYIHSQQQPFNSSASLTPSTFSNAFFLSLFTFASLPLLSFISLFS